MTSKQKTFLGASCIIFLVYGIFQSLYGAQASLIMECFNITSAQHGFILTMQCLGGMAVAVLCAFIGDKINKIKACALGIAAMGVFSVLTASFSFYTVMILCGLGAGVAFTFVDIMNNAGVSDAFAENKKKALPAIHIFFGTGSMAGPYIATLMANPKEPSSFANIFMIIGIASIISGIFYAFSAKNIKMPKIQAQEKDGSKSIFKDKIIWILMIGGILYFSFQRGIQTWYSTHLISDMRVDFNTAGLILTLFFAGSFVMRLLSPALFSKFNIKKLCMICVLVSAGLMTAALCVQNIIAITILTTASGFAQGLFVAAYMYMATDIYPNNSGTASSAMLIAINVGGMSSPLWIGKMAETVGYTLPLFICCALMALCPLFIWLSYKAAYKKGIKTEC